VSRATHRKQLGESLAHSVRQAFASVILFNQRVADDVGINLRDLQVLHLLLLHGPSTPRDLARSACVTTGGMTVVLDRLEKDGYVKRQANPADRRSCIVHLIPESLRKLEGVYKSNGELLAAAIKRYSDRDLRLLIGFFDQLNRERSGDNRG
jgi:MarR family transcriptional regulator, organic hydroperoxide resistance regulator